jgi:A/G-specific adenine glycosylase
MKKQQKTLSDQQIAAIEKIKPVNFTTALTCGGLTSELIDEFKFIINDYFNQFGRTFSWRTTTDPYQIMVSEIMLQQTQTNRVEGKFEEFIGQFSDFESLAQASVTDVITAWQGLGYNSRALRLQESAKKVVSEFGGILPDDPHVLVTFPGIGPNTAGSICAFAFNAPTVFIETNIRSVFIHFFFHDQQDVKDSDLVPLIAQTLDHANSRLWYYALMDYGVALKKLYPNPSRKSAHHTIQSRFEGSDRQVRGMILRILIKEGKVLQESFYSLIDRQEQKVASILEGLQKDGFIVITDGIVRLK